MKTIMFLSFFFSQFALASVLEVNKQESKIYFNPTPVLELSLIDLGNDGGVLTVFLDYPSDKTKAEMDEIQKNYPGYSQQPVMVEAGQGVVTFEIKALELSQEVALRQGQMGPYINTQVSLSKDQVRKFKTLNSLSTDVSLSIPVSSRYSSTQIMEEFSADSSLCRLVDSKNLADLVNSLSNFKKPERIKYSETFAALKKDMLAKCFDAAPASIHSFQEILQIPLTIKNVARLEGTCLQQVSRSQDFVLDMTVKAELN